jgi:signal transduction histidine kinase
MNGERGARVLLIDDMAAIHDDFRKLLAPDTSSVLDAAEAALFGAAPAGADRRFELDSAYQGEEGLRLVQRAVAEGRPYALAFVDMRMPPGWDGVETIERIWQCDPRVQVVICTAYSDYSWDTVLDRLDAGDRLLVLKKPFDAVEVMQLANTMTAKWTIAGQIAARVADLESAVQERTAALTRVNEALQREIRETKQLQVQLMQSEKLASIGQLAAGVAHEINNPIGYIFSNLGSLQKYIEMLLGLLTEYEIGLADGTPGAVARVHAMREQIGLDFLRNDIPELLNETREGVLRVRQIVQDLRDFSRVDSTQEWQVVDLHRGIETTLNIVASELKYRATLVREFGTLPPVECVPSQLNQVMLNLVVNAVHAIGAGPGTVTIRTGSDGEHAWIEVSDTGAGIADEHLSRIFDPFFTTKPVGEGTGLGLSVSYGIVQKHHGRMEVRSAPGQGTTFRVVLPVRQPREATEAPVSADQD